MRSTKEIDLVDEKNPDVTDLEPTGYSLQSDTLILTPQDDKRIQRRVDWNLMPILGVVVGWNFVCPSHSLLITRDLLECQLDKICISYASVMGFQKDCNLTPSQYSWLGSIVCEYAVYF
jgi:ACS family allantoate permease-like MFS transporter